MASEPEFESDEVPSVIPRTFSKTPRGDSRTSSAVLEDDEFQFPISRTPSAVTHTVSLEIRKRLEECYDFLKNGAFFDGPKYANEGLTREIVNYVRGSSGWTFLHQAAYHQHEPAIEWLIKNGANRTIRGRFDGKTPYDVALTNGKAKAASRVLELLEFKDVPPRGGTLLRRFAD